MQKGSKGIVRYRDPFTITLFLRAIDCLPSTLLPATTPGAPSTLNLTLILRPALDVTLG